jgi:hypothetical protein
MNSKKRFFILLAGFFIALFLAYKLSFKKALEAYREHHSLTELDKRAWQVETDLETWRAKSRALDNRLGTSTALGFEENLLNMVGLFCEEHKLDVDLFDQPAIGLQNGYRVETIMLKISGGFKELLSLLFHLERNFRSGRIASVSFEKEMNYKRGVEELYLKLYVQNIKPADNEH